MFIKKGAFERLFLWPEMIKPYYIALLTFVLSGPVSAEIYYSSSDSAPVEVTCGTSRSSNEFNEISRIRYIHDGDTLHLKGGRKVRLIGINTPELARDGKPAEPFALPAKQALQSLFAEDKTIALVYGKDKIDRYGRLLAHAYTSDGKNVQSALLSSGLASAIMIPPNTRFAHCYLQAERKARCAKVGIWRQHGIREAKDLDQKGAGFQLIHGSVNDIKFDDKGIWLNIDETLTVGIRPDEQYLFDKDMIKSLLDKTIVVRGWINKSRRETPFYMRIKHPRAIQQDDDISCH